MADLFSSTPDGKRYRAMSQGQRVERPYCLRWLMPYVARSDFYWIVIACSSVAACCALSVWYAHAWAAAFLVAGLSGVALFNVRHPILVDAPAMALALACACCVREGWWYVAVPLALASGATKESAPVFAALWAWSPLPLVGLVAPALRWLVRPGVDTINDTASEARANLRQVIWAQRRTLANPSYYLVPWGMCLLGLAHPSWQLVTVLLVAYAQLAIATDTARLFVWAFPVMVAATCHNVPEMWWWPMIAFHVANPFRGTGV